MEKIARSEIRKKHLILVITHNGRSVFKNKNIIINIVIIIVIFIIVIIIIVIIIVIIIIVIAIINVFIDILICDKIILNY